MKQLLKGSVKKLLVIFLLVPQMSYSKSQKQVRDLIQNRRADIRKLNKIRNMSYASCFSSMVQEFRETLYFPYHNSFVVRNDGIDDAKEFCKSIKTNIDCVVDILEEDQLGDNFVYNFDFKSAAKICDDWRKEAVISEIADKIGTTTENF